MKTNLFSTLLLAAALLASCGDNKTPGEEPAPTAGSRVVRIDWYNNHTSADQTGSTQLAYDAKGRLLSYAEQSGYRIDFTYDDSRFTGTARYFFPEEGASEQECRFNSLWCATYQRSADQNYTTEWTCTYDAEGRILKEEGKDISLDGNIGEVWTTAYTWANGNIVRIDEKYTASGSTDEAQDEWHTETTLLEYYDTPNPFAEAWVDPVITPYYDDFGIGMRGRHCRNLVKSITTPGADGEQDDTATFEYTFDDKGRVVRCDFHDNYSGSDQNRYDIYTYAE